MTGLEDLPTDYAAAIQAGADEIEAAVGESAEQKCKARGHHAASMWVANCLDCRAGIVWGDE